MTAPLCVFDAYGTLFDVAGAARKAAAEPGREALVEHWPALSAIWRRKQLEYSWLRAVAGAHVDFRTVTCEALDYAMEACGLSDDALRERLRALYRVLPAYPEAAAMLRAVRAAGAETAILTNGSPAMVGDAVESAGLSDLLDAVLTVEEAGVFKPSALVYDLVQRRFDVAERARILFVSSNGWDAGCAAGYGFTTLWVNRGGDPVDRLPWRPAHVAADLSAVPDIAATL